MSLSCVSRGVAILAALLLASSAAGARECWKELRYSASNGWLGASSVISYSLVPNRGELHSVAAAGARIPGGDELGKIHVDFKAMSNKGSMDIWLDPQTGGALQTLRTSHGKDSRQKFYRYLDQGVWRERRKSVDDSTTFSPGAGSVLPYPIALRTAEPVLHSLMLLERAAELLRSGKPASSHLVYTDTQLYRVELRVAGTRKLPFNFSLLRGSSQSKLSGSREVERIDVRAQLLGNEPEQDPFTLLELGGELAVFIDHETGLPLRIQGSLPVLGTVPVGLSSAVLAAGCAK